MDDSERSLAHSLEQAESAYRHADDLESGVLLEHLALEALELRRRLEAELAELLARAAVGDKRVRLSA